MAFLFHWSLKTLLYLNRSPQGKAGWPLRILCPLRILLYLSCCIVTSYISLSLIRIRIPRQGKAGSRMCLITPWILSNYHNIQQRLLGQLQQPLSSGLCSGCAGNGYGRPPRQRLWGEPLYGSSSSICPNHLSLEPHTSLPSAFPLWLFTQLTSNHCSFHPNLSWDTLLHFPIALYFFLS